MKIKLLFSFIIVFFISCSQIEDLGNINSVKQQQGKLNSSVEKPLVTAYFPSPLESKPHGSDSISNLRRLPKETKEITHLYLSSVHPLMTYEKGSYDLKNTGLTLPYDGKTFKKSLSILKNNGIRVILSIARAPYSDGINCEQIRDLVEDLGFDGVTLDFNTSVPKQINTYEVFTNYDKIIDYDKFTNIVRKMRQLLPKSLGYELILSPFGGGIETSNPYDKDMDFIYKQIGDLIDFVDFKGFRAGMFENREIMYDFHSYYANQYGFRVAFNMLVPAEYPDYVYTKEKAEKFTEYVAKGGIHNRAGKGDGVGFWYVLRISSVEPEMNGIEYCKIADRILNQK